jgi:hypothetical protein
MHWATFWANFYAQSNLVSLVAENNENASQSMTLIMARRTTLEYPF